MTLEKTLPILLLATSLATFGCKKKDDAATGAAATGSMAKPAETGSATGAAMTPPAAPAAAPAGATTIASDDDYIAKGTAFLDKLTEIFKAGGTNCDKIADDLNKLAAESSATINGLQAYEKAHPDAKKKAEAATKDKTTAFEAAAGPAIGACQKNQKLGDALNKIGPS
jgi:hypothetical protein